METINLEEILSDYTTVSYQDSPYTNNSAIDKYDCKLAMLEFGKQLLELAAENAEIETHQNGCRECGAWGVSDKSILDTINQVV